MLNHLKFDFIIVGVFRELLTIPFLLAQPVFIVIGINHLYKKEKQILNTISLATLFICTFFTIASFF